MIFNESSHSLWDQQWKTWLCQTWRTLDCMRSQSGFCLANSITQVTQSYQLRDKFLSAVFWSIHLSKMTMWMCDLLAVGEPINHEAWEWFHNMVGDGRCPLVDTWWQTGKMHSAYDCQSLHLYTVPLILRLAALMGWFTPCVTLFWNK